METRLSVGYLPMLLFLPIQETVFTLFEKSNKKNGSLYKKWRMVLRAFLQAIVAAAIRKSFSNDDRISKDMELRTFSNSFTHYRNNNDYRMEPKCRNRVVIKNKSKCLLTTTRTNKISKTSAFFILTVRIMYTHTLSHFWLLYNCL